MTGVALATSYTPLAGLVAVIVHVATVEAVSVLPVIAQPVPVAP